MTDKELLELAAKAFRARIIKDPHGQLRDCSVSHHPAMNIFAFPTWNPLKNDGDALRLAVELKLDISFGNGYYFDEGDMTFCGERWDGGESRWFKRFVKHNGDPYAATRRAIVRAAAEIGKEMK